MTHTSPIHRLLEKTLTPADKRAMWLASQHPVAVVQASRWRSVHDLQTKLQEARAEALATRSDIRSLHERLTEVEVTEAETRNVMRTYIDDVVGRLRSISDSLRLANERMRSQRP